MRFWVTGQNWLGNTGIRPLPVCCCSDRSRQRRREDSLDADQLSCPSTPYAAQSPGDLSSVASPISSVTSPPSAAALQPMSEVSAEAATEQDLDSLDFSVLETFNVLETLCLTPTPPVRQTAQVLPQVSQSRLAVDRNVYSAEQKRGRFTICF